MGREDGECDTASFVHRAEAHDEIALRIIRSASVRTVKMNERAGGLSCGIDIQTLISTLDGIRNDRDDLAEQGHVLVEGNFIDFCVDITAHEGIRGTCKSIKKNSVRCSPVIDASAYDVININSKAEIGVLKTIVPLIEVCRGVVSQIGPTSNTPPPTISATEVFV